MGILEPTEAGVLASNFFTVNIWLYMRGQTYVSALALRMFVRRKLFHIETIFACFFDENNCAFENGSFFKPE